MKYITIILVLLFSLSQSFAQETYDTITQFDYTLYEEVVMVTKPKLDKPPVFNIRIEDQFFPMDKMTPVSMSKEEFLDQLEKGFVWAVNHNLIRSKLLILKLEVENQGDKVRCYSPVGLKDVDLKNRIDIGSHIDIIKTQIVANFNNKPIDFSFSIIID